MLKTSVFNMDKKKKTKRGTIILWFWTCILNADQLKNYGFHPRRGIYIEIFESAASRHFQKFLWVLTAQSAVLRRWLV
jgi:hypothetical protein